MTNKDLRRRIVEMVRKGKDGHIPSAFSLVELISSLYGGFLKYEAGNPAWPDRDYFILSKGHGCLALFTVLRRHGILAEDDLDKFCTREGILGEHPDCTRVPGVEASTGSLGHGFPFAVGLALGLRIAGLKNRVCVLVGDGECQEGTVWEAANVANNLQLGNLCVLVDWNGSAAQLMPRDALQEKWKAFGWNASVIDGHSEPEIKAALGAVNFSPTGTPTVLLARTVKGKGVPLLEGHGPWHHRVPNDEEYAKIMEALS